MDPNGLWALSYTLNDPTPAQWSHENPGYKDDGSQPSPGCPLVPAVATEGSSQACDSSLFPTLSDTEETWGIFSKLWFCLWPWLQWSFNILLKILVSWVAAWVLTTHWANPWARSAAQGNPHVQQVGLHDAHPRCCANASSNLLTANHPIMLQFLLAIRFLPCQDILPSLLLCFLLMIHHPSVAVSCDPCILPHALEIHPLCSVVGSLEPQRMRYPHQLFWIKMLLVPSWSVSWKQKNWIAPGQSLAGDTWGFLSELAREFQTPQIPELARAPQWL